MATITIYGHTGTHSVDSLYAIASNKAIGMGYDSSAWPSNILKDATARFMCALDGQASDSSKEYQLNCVSYHSTDFYKYTTAGQDNIIDEAEIPSNGFTGDITQSQLLKIKFEHDNQVDVNPIQLWFSSGSSGTEEYTFASVWIMECSATGSQDWTSQCNPSNKVSFTAHVATALEHGWHCGLSLTPVSDLVGFNNDGYLQVSMTYS